MSQRFEISNEPVFTVQQVADQLQLSTATIYALVRRGELAAVRIGSGRGTIRIRESDVARFIETNAIQVRPMSRMKQQESSSDLPPLKHLKLKGDKHR